MVDGVDEGGGRRGKEGPGIVLLFIVTQISRLFVLIPFRQFSNSIVLRMKNDQRLPQKRFQLMFSRPKSLNWVIG